MIKRERGRNIERETRGKRGLKHKAKGREAICKGKFTDSVEIIWTFIPSIRLPPQRAKVIH